MLKKTDEQIKLSMLLVKIPEKVMAAARKIHNVERPNQQAKDDLRHFLNGRAPGSTMTRWDEFIQFMWQAHNPTNGAEPFKVPKAFSHLVENQSLPESTVDDDIDNAVADLLNTPSATPRSAPAPPVQAPQKEFWHRPELRNPVLFEAFKAELDRYEDCRFYDNKFSNMTKPLNRSPRECRDFLIDSRKDDWEDLHESMQSYYEIICTCHRNWVRAGRP
jgi:hypothetical protein